MRSAPSTPARSSASATSPRSCTADYRLGLPGPGFYREILNTDSEWYGGSNVGNDGGVHAEPVASHGWDYSAAFTLPPLAVIWLATPE